MASAVDNRRDDDKSAAMINRCATALALISGFLHLE
jgi:hypothetical protein